MFQKILAIVFCAVFSFNGFCMRSSAPDLKFKDHATAANFFINVLGESNGVRLSIVNDGVNIFERKLNAAEYNSLPDMSENDVSLCKQNDDILCQIYSAPRGVFFSFLFNLNGDIELSSSGARETGMAQNTKFAFQTNKSVKNHNPIAFHHLAISCDDFYNYSVLQMNAYALFAKYYYNAGVIDSKSGRASVPLGLQNYVDMGFIAQKPAEPSRKAGIFDNFGAFLGRDVRALGNLSFNSTGSLNTENLFVQNGSVSAGRNFDISGSLSGKVDSFRIAPQTFAHVGTMQVDPIKNLVNQGNLHISKSSKLDVESLENEGEITGAQSLDILVDTLKNDKGIILAQEALNLVKRSKEGIKQQIHAGEEAKMEFGKLLGSKIKIQHHTDYYLNTITDHYTRDQFGRETFSHKTETGYIFQRRETKTEEKELPAEVRKQIAEALKLKDKQLEFLRLSLKLLDKIEETLKAQINGVVAESGSADDVVVDVHTLRSVLKADDPRSLDQLLLAPRVYEALSSHNVALRSFLSFLGDKGDINKVFAEQRTAPVIAPPKTSRRPSFSDLSHIANVESKANGLSFESVASNLTLWRYEMERLAAANPDSYKALLTAWDARVKATMAVGAIDALAMALETGGTSLAAYGLSLGTGLGLDYLADFVVKHGAEKAATLASDGNPRLYESYQKTFNYVGAMVAQHGIRAGLKKITSSSRSSSSSSSSTSSSAAAPRQTKSTILQTRDYSTSFNTALKQKTHLAFEEAGVLTRDGRLTPKALGKSSHIPLEGGIKNKIIKETLTADGSQISDWGKYKTQSVTLPTGESRQIHFYMNKKTGKVDYETVDFKISRDVSLGEGLE